MKPLDKATLEFAIKIAWQFKHLCKHTEVGKTEAKAFAKVQSTLQYYLDSAITEEVNICIK